jgi:predicted histone-like DNA-binding protein
MAINYKVTKCRNPKGDESLDYFKGTVVKTSDYDFDDLVDDIALATTVTKGDAMAVLASIKPFVTKALLAGRRVVLQDLGSFHVSLQGKCYTEAQMKDKEFSPSAYIKGHRVVFRPEVNLKKDIAKGFALKRVSSDAMA